jgi:RNA polymerase sigma-70 factor (ECF subfamily)
VAETFLTAFRKRRRYQHGYANARPWLYGIATHLVGQHYRDLARQHRLHQAAGPAPVAPDFPNGRMRA